MCSKQYLTDYESNIIAYINHVTLIIDVRALNIRKLQPLLSNESSSTNVSTSLKPLYKVP